MVRKFIASHKKLIILAILLVQTCAYGEKGTLVPLDFQYKMILKIVSFDRNFKKIHGDTFVIGLFKESGSKSVYEKEFRSIIKSQHGKTLNHLPIKFKTITEKEIGNITKEDISLLMFLPEIKNIKHYLGQVKDSGILTAGFSQKYVEIGAGIGIGLKNNGKPQILINLKSIRSTRSDFGSNLLSLAKIYR